MHLTLHPGQILALSRRNVPWRPPNHGSPSLSAYSAAKSKPIIAEPEIHGAQPLDGVTGFLVLMSEGLYKALEAAHGPGQANQVSWALAQHSQPALLGSTVLRDPEPWFSKAISRQLLSLQSWEKKKPSALRTPIPPQSCACSGLEAGSVLGA